MPATRLPTRSLTAAGVAAAALLFVGRGPDRLLHPSFWAEDGQLFFAGAQEHPLSAVVRPYRGYLHLVPRVVASLSSPLPVAWQPGLYAWVAVLLTTAVCALVLSHRVRWLLPRPWQRALALGLLVSLPGADETYANIANLVFVAGLLLLVVSLLEDPRTRLGRHAETGCVAVAGLTGPFVVLALPALLARDRRTRTGHSRVLLLVAVGCAATQVVVLLLGDHPVHHGLTAGAVARFGTQDLARAWVTGVDRASPLPLAASVAVLAMLAACLAGQWRRLWGAALMVALGVASGLWAWGFVVVRPYSGERHLLLPLSLAVLAGVAALTRGRVIAVTGAVLLVSGVGGIAASWRVQPLPHRPVDELARCLGAGAPVCTGPANPDPARWEVVVRRP